MLEGAAPLSVVGTPKPLVKLSHRPVLHQVITSLIVILSAISSHSRGGDRARRWPPRRGDRGRRHSPDLWQPAISAPLQPTISHLTASVGVLHCGGNEWGLQVSLQTVAAGCRAQRPVWRPLAAGTAAQECGSARRPQRRLNSSARAPKGLCS